MYTILFELVPYILSHSGWLTYPSHIIPEHVSKKEILTRGSLADQFFYKKFDRASDFNRLKVNKRNAYALYMGCRLTLQFIYDLSI